MLSKYLELEENGIFDIALDMDSNYFINVKLLEKTTIPEFKHSYKKINNFFREIYVLLKNTASVNDRTFNVIKEQARPRLVVIDPTIKASASVY